MVYLLLWACAPPTAAPTTVASRGDLEVRLDVKGEFEAKEASRVVNPLPGWPEITFIVDEGTKVKKGDVLVKLKTEEYEKELVEVRAELEASEVRIEQARARLQLKVGEARARVVSAELDAELAQLRQTDSETVPRVEREQAHIAALQSKMVTDSASSHLRRLELESKSEIQILQLESAINRMKVEKLEKNISLASLTSPADGLVLIEELWDEKFKVGKEVPLAYTIINLPDISNLQVVGWVHEVDSPKVQLGQTARVTMDAHPDTKVDATVVKVASLAVTRGDHDERYLRVVLELAETLPKMKPGMTVETDLLVRSLTDAVLIPSEAVFPSPEGPVVYVDDGQAKSVTILATDGTRTAVEGVDPGTSVWTVSADSWTPGGPS